VNKMYSTLHSIFSLVFLLHRLYYIHLRIDVVEERKPKGFGYVKSHKHYNYIISIYAIGVSDDQSYQFEDHAFHNFIFIAPQSCPFGPFSLHLCSGSTQFLDSSEESCAYFGIQTSRLRNPPVEPLLLCPAKEPRRIFPCSHALWYSGGKKFQ